MAADGEILSTAYVRIRPDDDGFEQDAEAKIRTALDRINTAVRVRAETGEADADIDHTKEKLDRLGSKTTDVKVKVSEDTSGGGEGGAGLLGLLAGLTPALGTVGVVGAGAGAGLAAGFASAGLGAAAFGAVAVPVLKSALTQQTALTAAQAAYAKASAQLDQAATKSQRLTAMKAEAVALQAEQSITSKMSADQLTFLGLLGQTKTAYTDIQTDVAPQVFTVANQGLKDAGPLLAALPGLVGSATPALLGLEQQLGQSLSGAGFAKFRVFVEDEAPTAITDLGRAAGNIGATVGHALEALTPLTNSTLTGLDALTSRLGSANLGPGSGFSKFIGYVQTNGPAVEHTVGDIAEAAGGLAVAIAPLGPPLLNVVDGLASILKQAAPTVEEIAHGLTPAIQGFGDGLHILAPVIGPIVGDVGALLLAFKGFEAVKGASVSVGLLGKAAEGASGSTGKKGLLGAVESLGGSIGPLGIALGAVAGGGFLAFQEYTSAAAKNAKADADIIKMFTSQIGENNAQSYDTAATKLDLIGKAFDKAGIGGKKFATEAEDLREQSGLLTVNMSLLGQTTGLGAAGLTKLADKAGVDLTGPLAAAAAKLATLALFTGDNATEIGQLSSAYDDFHKPAMTAQDAVDGLNNAFGAFNARLGDTQAADAFTTTMRDSEAALKAEAKGLDGNSAAAIANRTTIEQDTQALEAHLVAMAKDGASKTALTTAYKDGYAAILADAAGQSTDATATGRAKDAQALLNTAIGLTPPLLSALIKTAPLSALAINQIGAAASGARDDVNAAALAIAGLESSGLSQSLATSTLANITKATSVTDRGRPIIVTQHIHPAPTQSSAEIAKQTIARLNLYAGTS